MLLTCHEENFIKYISTDLAKYLNIKSIFAILLYSDRIQNISKELIDLLLWYGLEPDLQCIRDLQTHNKINKCIIKCFIMAGLSEDAKEYILQNILQFNETELTELTKAITMIDMSGPKSAANVHANAHASANANA